MPKSQNISAAKKTSKRAALSAKQEARKRRKKLFRNIFLGVLAFLVIAYIVIVNSLTVYGTVKYGICKTIMELSVPFPETIKISVVRDPNPGQYSRITFSHVDSFGQYRLTRLQCNFEPDQDLANRQWLRSVIEAQGKQGRSFENISRSAGVDPQVILEYLSGKRAKLPDNQSINRIAQAVGSQPPGPVFNLSSVTIDGRAIEPERLKRLQKVLYVMAEKLPDLAYPPPPPGDISEYKQ